MPVICSVGNCNKSAVLKRPKTSHPMCKECFFYSFETEIHITILKSNLFKNRRKIAIGASGGKDSTVLAYVLKLLNERYNYGLDLFLLSIDEGITGYRDDSLETVKQNRDDYQLPLKILSYKDLYAWTMDEIVAQVGQKNNCTFCGVFRRQALDRGAAILGADMIVTGHNADDIAETIIMNILRGDVARLSRCTNIVTEGEGTIPRCKPLKYAYEKEIVMYAHFKKLVYFSTECIYSPNAYRGYTREYIKEVERLRPSCILDIIYSGETMCLKESIKLPKRGTCVRCGFVASQKICKACVLLEGLNTGMPKLGIGKSNKAKKIMGFTIDDGSKNKNNKKQPKCESKKIVNRSQKQSDCEEECNLSCQSQRHKSTIIDDLNISFLSLDAKNKVQEIFAAKDSFVSLMLKECSDDEVVNAETRPKKEKIICKCPSRLRTNIQTKQSDTPQDTNSNSDDKFFLDMELVMKLLNVRNSLLEEENSEYLISEFTNKLNNPVNKPLCKSKQQNSVLQIDNQLHYFTQSQLSDLTSSFKDKRLQLNDVQQIQMSSSTMEEFQHSKMQLLELDNTKPFVKIPVLVVKAKPKKIKPSIILPKMMHKAKNNLDF